MMREDIQAWATAYIEAQQNPDLLKGNHPLWWAVERFINMGSEVSPEDCWSAILEILSRGPPEQILGNSKSYTAQALRKILPGGRAA